MMCCITPSQCSFDNLEPFHNVGPLAYGGGVGGGNFIINGQFKLFYIFSGVARCQKVCVCGGGGGGGHTDT